MGSKVDKQIGSSVTKASTDTMTMVLIGNIQTKLNELLIKQLDVSKNSNPDSNNKKKQLHLQLNNMLLSLTDYMNNAHPAPHEVQRSDGFILSVQYICNHYTDPDISLEKVATYASIGRCYLSTLFRKKTGNTFSNLVTHLRMEKALALISNTPLLIYEISEIVGYNNSTYFSTKFKKHFGKTPKEYRKTNSFELVAPHYNLKKLYSESEFRAISNMLKPYDLGSFNS